MAPAVQKVSSPLQLGEGPHWDADSQTLYFVDILGNTIHRYKPASAESSVLSEGVKCATFILPVEGRPDTFLASMKKRVVLISWDGRSTHPQVVENLFEVEKDKDEGFRINDGKADPSGRVWFGSMGSLDMNSPFEASLFSIAEGPKPVTRVTQVGLSNGLAWTSDNKTMFYVDSHKCSVDAFNYDITSGDISNRRVVFDLKAKGIHGFPDGLTIDSEDKLWLAVFNGGKVLRINPADGSLLSSIDIPAPEVTSVAFGGPALDELYVTTACMGLTKEMREKFPDAGSLFRITGLNVKGRPGRAAKV